MIPFSLEMPHAVLFGRGVLRRLPGSVSGRSARACSWFRERAGSTAPRGRPSSPGAWPGARSGRFAARPRNRASGQWTRPRRRPPRFILTCWLPWEAVRSWTPRKHSLPSRGFPAPPSASWKAFPAPRRCPDPAFPGSPCRRPRARAPRRPRTPSSSPSPRCQAQHAVPSTCLRTWCWQTPELTLSLPLGVTGTSGLDAFTQLIEAYVSRATTPRCVSRQGRIHPDVGRAEASAGIAAGHRVPREGELPRPRERQSPGREQLGAAHGFAAAVGGMYNVPHGLACAVFLPHVLAANRDVIGGSHRPAGGRSRREGTALTRWDG